MKEKKRKRIGKGESIILFTEYGVLLHNNATASRFLSEKGKAIFGREMQSNQTGGKLEARYANHPPGIKAVQHKNTMHSGWPS